MRLGFSPQCEPLFGVIGRCGAGPVGRGRDPRPVIGLSRLIAVPRGIYRNPLVDCWPRAVHLQVRWRAVAAVGV